MGRAGKIHLVNNWYNCAGNTEYAVNPRLNSEFLIQGNYFATGVVKTFRNQNSIAVTCLNNTVSDPSATTLASSGSTVEVPYTLGVVAPAKIPDMIDLLVGPVLDCAPDFDDDENGAVNPDNHGTAGEAEKGYYRTVTTNRAKQGITFSVWANYTMNWQWYKATQADLSDAVAIDGATRNSYTFSDATETTTYFYCVATGLGGSDQSNTIRITVSGSDATPEFTTNINDYATQAAYTAVVGSEFSDLTVDAGEGVTYQWYKNSVASTDDATLISGATSATYTFTPGATEKSLGFQFFFCVATSEADRTLSAYSNIARVSYKAGDSLINFIATTVAIGKDGCGDTTGLTLIGTDLTSNANKLNSAKYNTGSSKLGILQLNTGYKAGNVDGLSSIKLSYEGGFKAGDVITVAGFINNAGAGKRSTFDIFALTGEDNALVGGTYLARSEDVINGATATSGEPTEITYTLTQDYTNLYVGRGDGNTGLDISKIIVFRGEPEAPYIKTDLDDESIVEATVDRATELSIVAENAQSYAWYTCTSPFDYEANKVQIPGQTSATCSYTPTAPGTTYVYCVVTNGSGDKAKSTNSKIAIVKATAATGGGTQKVTYTWDFDNGTGKRWDGFTTSGSSSDAGKLVGSYGSVEDANQKMDYLGYRGSIANSKSGVTIDDIKWYYYLQLGGGSLTKSGGEDRVLRYTVPYPGKIKAYVGGANNSAGRNVYLNKSLSTTGAKSAAGGDGTNTLYDVLEMDVEAQDVIYIWCDANMRVFGVVAELEEPGGGCSTPKEERGAWSGDAAQTWTYTVSSTTATAYIHYKINDGEEQVAEKKSVDLALSPGDKVTAWAVDSEGTLETSDVYEFTADAAAQAETPVATVGTYSVAEKGFAITLAVSDGSTIHYTTDGTEPTAGSATYSSTIYALPGSTVKAVALKDYYGASAVVSNTLPVFETPSGDETICASNGKDSNANNVGASYFVSGSDYNAGAIDGNQLDKGIKFRTSKKKLANGKTGFRIQVNDGFIIKKIEVTDMQTNQKSTAEYEYEVGEEKTMVKSTYTAEKITGVYVDGSSSSTPFTVADESVDSYVVPFTDQQTSKVVFDNLNAKEYIDFACDYISTNPNKSYGQIRATFTVYYEIDDAPVSVTVTGKVNGVDDQTVIAIGGFTDNSYTIDKAVKKYDDTPTVTLDTREGYHYEMNSVAAEGGYSGFSLKLMDVTYTVNALVSAIKSPFIHIDEAGKGLQLYRDAEGNAKAGYKVTLDGWTAGTPMIKLDGGTAEAYDTNKEYYALKTVGAYCDYIDENDDPASTGIKTENCPANDYDENKPFAIYIYQSGYNDSGAGQEDGASSSSWAKAQDTDQIYLGLKDQYNVIDLVLDDSDQKKMINEVRPDIRNAQLVVVSEMIGSKSPDASSVYAASKLQDAIMSVRDSLIGYTNVLNLKMFFYSQSQNNNTRWAWAQPATLSNDIVSIVPKNSMFKVFENVSFSRDGSLQLWSGFDEESTLNRLQLVHNFNEENEDLPGFNTLATVTDEYGEEYDALHYFERNRYTYVATGISINDFAHYDENLRSLVSTIGKMINDKESLGTLMTGAPAPRIKDNGDGSATITNNNADAVTYYLTGAETSNYSAEAIKAGNKKTVDLLTDKFSADTWVWAISDVKGTLSQVAKAEVKGTTDRYFHRLNTDASAEGVEADLHYNYNDASITVPYNQSFRKAGYTVTQWKVRGSDPAVYYKPGQVITDPEVIAQDLYLEAVWTENTKTITDAGAADEELRTVTWNFLQSDGAPALSLEYGSTKVAQQGFIVGQMHFSNDEGDFIDVVLDIDVDNTVKLPDTGDEEYTGKFNNKQNSLTDPSKYITEFAQVRNGTKFTFPSVYGMTVRYKQATFEKVDGDKYEADVTYVNQSTLTDGTLDNPGLNMADGKVTVDANGKAKVNTTYGADNLSNGGKFSYEGEDSLATLVSRESAYYATPSSGASSKTVGALNYGTAFMHSLSVTYPKLYDLTKVVNFPDGHVNILPNYEDMTDEEIADRAADVTLSSAKKNTGGHYVDGETVNITVKPGYGFYFEEGSNDVTMTNVTGSISVAKKQAEGENLIITGAPKVTINLNQQAVYPYTVDWTPLDAGSVRINSNTGKDESAEYTAFPKDSTITIMPTPKVGYQFEKWQDENAQVYVTLDAAKHPTLYENEIEFPDGVTMGDYGVLTVTVNSDNATSRKYIAVFEDGKEGTTYYELPIAGLVQTDGKHRTFTEIWDTIEGRTAADTTALFNMYHTPKSLKTSALYIPTNYTLYKPGYTLNNWVYIPEFEGEKEYEVGTEAFEYKIGEYRYFDKDGEERHIIPIFRENAENFDYRNTTADITWDFRTAYYAQHLDYADTEVEIDYATHATINGNVVIDVPLHIKGKMDNTSMDEWCHFDVGTVITIPSGLGATFTLVTYSKLTSTTIDGVVPLKYTTRTENDIPVYYYTYTTQNPATSIDLVIGKDHTYYKYIRAQLPSADKVTLTTKANNESWGGIAFEKANTTPEAAKDATVAKDVTSTSSGNVHTMALGSWVRIKATRERLYELKSFVIDGDTIPVETADDVAAAEAKGYTVTLPTGTDKDYSLVFQLFSYATTVEAVYGTREKFQITYSSGGQAYGEAPGVQVVEDGEPFTIPTKNQTLYLEGYTLKYWKDEEGHKYQWGTSYTIGEHSDAGGFDVPRDNLYLTPIFEINDFTLFNLPTGWHAVTWPLAKDDGAPLLKYQKSSGVYVSQLTVGDRFIDLPLNINCAETGKVDNSSTGYRCQINSGSVMTLLTSEKCRITLYTSNGELSSTKIAGETSYTSNLVSGTQNDQYATVSYTGKAATQNIQFTGDAGYFKMVKVEYGKVDNTDNLPQLSQVTINNIALGSFGSPYENYLLSKLQSDKVMTIKIDLSTKALTMPTVKAEADKSDAIVEVRAATVDSPTATIIVKTKEGATVGIYKLEFIAKYVDIPAPVMQKIEMNGQLVKARDNSGTLQKYLDEDAPTMAVNGAINITFDHEMNPTDTINTSVGKVVAKGGKTLTFSYWGLEVNGKYTFTIPSSALKDVYNNDYSGEPVTFSFTTKEKSQNTDRSLVNFVVTHKQTHTFNSATNGLENYTSTAKRQVASDELIANLEAAGIAYGTIDEGVALANSAVGTDRYYIFVPDGEYQLRGNQSTDAISSAPYDNNGKPRSELMAKIYNGVTAITKNNVSITGQSETDTKLFNKPEIEGVSYTSTFMVANGVSGFYVQDMTLTNKFDYKGCVGGGSSKACAVVLRDRGTKTIMKNVTMDSWQDTYYSNVLNEGDTRGYFENCTIKGYVDFVCGDGDHWFEKCNLVMRNGKAGTASNMMAPSTSEKQKWGYVFNNCEVNVEDAQTYATCNGKFTLARPWKLSPAVSFLYTKYNVLPTDDGYKQMASSGLVLRFHEYGSLDSNDALLDLSGRSLRASSPGAGSYSAVMTPSEAAEYTVHNALGGTDGYDPTLYTKQISMADANLTTLDRSLTWTEKNEALCYFIFRKNAQGEYELYAITAENSYELDDTQIGKTFMVRAANQRGGLGEPSNELTYNVHESYQLTLVESQRAPIKEGTDPDTGADIINTYSWSTIYLDYNAKAPTVSDEDKNAKAYVYAVVDVTSTSMTLKRVNILEKNQGYIVKGDVGTYTFAYTDSDGEYYDGSKEVTASKAASEDRLSILDGTVETIDRAGMNVYTLYYKQNYGLGFYNYTGDYLNAYRAYLNGSYVDGDGTGSIVIEGGSSGDGRGFIFLDDFAPTNIGNVNGNANTNADDSEKIFTVYGQRVKRSEMIKGRVYIVNGRKIAY